MNLRLTNFFRSGGAPCFLFSLFLLLAFTQCSKKSLPKGDSDNGGLFLPDGFEALVVVDSLEGRARHIAVDDLGDIYVKLRFPDSIGGNLVIRVNSLGKADNIVKFDNYDDKGSYGTAMRIYNGYLYFSSELNVFRQKLTPGQLVPEGEIELIVRDDHAHGRHEHIAKPVTFDGEGNIYVPFGAPSNGCQIQNRTPESPGIYPCPLLEDHGGIWKFDANKLNQTQKDGSLYATGLRSVLAMEWNHLDNSLYVIQHGRDDLVRLWPKIYSPWQSALLPSEEFLKIEEGSDAGWPYFYYDQLQGKKVLNPEYMSYANELGDGSQFTQPIIGFPGHWAPNDIFFYKGEQFPEHYKNGAFITFHGSTNRAPYPQAGYFIAFIPYQNGTYKDNWEVFADGFSGLDTIMNVQDAVYRPMGLSMGKDGSVYMSDTEKGKIWRVMFKGDKKNFGAEQLANMEKRKSLSHIKTPDEEKDNLDKGLVFGGEKVYKLYCGTCHQGDGKGDGARFPPLDESEWVNGNKKKLIDLILNGLEGPIEVKGKPYNNLMPQHSFLSDDDIAKVLTYVRQSFGNKSDGISLHEVARVRAGKQ